MILLCHNTLAKSYDSKIGLIIQKRCILVTVFAALLLPILLYACYIICCSPVTNIAVFLVTGYNHQAHAVRERMDVVPEADAADEHQADNKRQVPLDCTPVPSTICQINHTRMEMAKIIPPPRSTMLVCELRWLGLSMMLHLSAILKYSSSAAKSMTAIITYIQIIFLYFLFFSRQSTLVTSSSIGFLASCMADGLLSAAG